MTQDLIEATAVVIFALYSVGLICLFTWLVIKCVRGDIAIFSSMYSRRGEAGGGGAISLSKLQMFLWTLVLVFSWLYQMVTNPGEFPELPSQALLLMGISGGAYLGAKSIATNAKRPVVVRPKVQPPPSPAVAVSATAVVDDSTTDTDDNDKGDGE